VSVYKTPQHRFSLLRTCRQIYAETGILSYTLSTFTFTDGRYLSMWMKIVSANTTNLARQIRSVKFGLDSTGIVYELECIKPYNWENFFPRHQLCKVNRVDIRF